MPRLREDGALNGLRFDRLKGKLGNRSNPTAEVELDGARGALVGEEGRGVRAIMAMIGGTRHDCVLGSTAVMRLGTAEAIHWAAHRQAFGRRLLDQAAMTRRAGRPRAGVRGGDGRRAAPGARPRAGARAATRDAERLRRIAAPVLKYWTCKRAPHARRGGARVPGRLRLHRGARGWRAPTARRR